MSELYTKSDVDSLLAYLNTTPIDEIDLSGVDIDLIVDALIYYSDNFNG